MKILVIADPPARLRPQGDSTLVLARELLRRKHEVFWALHTDLAYHGDHLRVRASGVTACPKDQAPSLDAPAVSRLDGFSAVLIRKDPPFDASYVKLCWLLALEESRVWMLNKPSLLLRYHEKLLPLEAVAHGFLAPNEVIPTHIGPSDGAEGFVREGGFPKVVVKPFFGFGGNGVFLMEGEGLKLPDEDVLVQPFRDEVLRRGDRRAFFLDGKLVAHFVRMPKAGGFISNLAQGGTAVVMKLEPGEQEVLERLGKFLKAIGIGIAGADLIGPCVSEVNITSPTGLRSLEALEGKDYGAEIAAFIERNASITGSPPSRRRIE